MEGGREGGREEGKEGKRGTVMVSHRDRAKLI